MLEVVRCNGADGLQGLSAPFFLSVAFGRESLIAFIIKERDRLQRGPDADSSAHAYLDWLQTLPRACSARLVPYAPTIERAVSIATSAGSCQDHLSHSGNAEVATTGGMRRPHLADSYLSLSQLPSCPAKIAGRSSRQSHTAMRAEGSYYLTGQLLDSDMAGRGTICDVIAPLHPPLMPD